MSLPIEVEKKLIPLHEVLPNLPIRAHSVYVAKSGGECRRIK